LRVENSELIEKKKGILALKDQLLEEMYSEFNGLSFKKNEIETRIQDFQQGMKSDIKKQSEKLNTLRQELKQNSENYREKLEDYKKLRDLMKKDREVLVMREKNYSEVNKTFTVLKKDFQSKENFYRNKVMELTDYMNIFGKMKNCVRKYIICCLFNFCKYRILFII